MLALRWGSRTMAGLGILGALASPMLLNAPANLLTVGFLAVALAAASAVLIWQRWEWLQIAAFALAMVQVANALLDVPGPGLWSTVGVLGLFGALNLVAALGYEVRVPTATLRTSAALLVSANALIMGGIGYLVLLDDWGVRVAGFWLAAVCLAHVDAGLVALTWRRVSRAIGIVLLGVALTAGNLAFAVLVDGPTLAIGWALSALALAALARRRGAEGRLAQGTVAGQLTLAIVHTLMFDTPPDSLGGGSVAYAPLVACVIAAFGCARLSRDGNGPWRIAADAAGLVGSGYVSALALDGPALVIAWVAQALALLPIARRTGDGLATIGVFGFLGAAVAHAVVIEAPPDALVWGVESFPASALALAAVVGGALVLARARLGGPPVSHALWLGAGAATGYLVSIGIVDAFQTGASLRQQGQAVLSAFWSAVGLALLWIGLRRDARPVRLTGFALLALAVGKVFFFDMSALESGYRVGSFVVLGLLLLAGAYAYQRMRQALAVADG